MAQQERAVRIVDHRRRLPLAAGLALLIMLTAAKPAAAASITERVSVSSIEEQGYDFSFFASMSSDGRFVAFTSSASNLVPRDTNRDDDVFVRDRQTGVTERVSVSSRGRQANRDSGIPSGPSISADGRFVAFESTASNLVPGDRNRSTSCFGGGGTCPATDVFVRDRQTGTTEVVSVNSMGDLGNTDSGEQSISADGRFVAFTSDATNLISGDTNEDRDIFVHDRETGITELVSVSSTGEQGVAGSDEPSISANGAFVVFRSYATNLVANDTNGFFPDVYLHDRQTGTTELVGLSSLGEQDTSEVIVHPDPKVSADGRFVAFASFGTLVPEDTNDAVDIFLRDRQTDTTERVSVDSTGAQANGSSFTPSISGDGRFVAFDSVASNLVPGDTNDELDVFVRDRQINTTERVSVDSTGAQGNGDSALGFQSAISGDGRFVAFGSQASNLVDGDTNGVSDVFVRDRSS